VQIEDMSQLHRFLATTSKPRSIDLKTYLVSICANLRLAVAEDVQIIEEFDPGCVLSPDHMLPLAQIVAEVFTNAIKHGQSTTSGAIIRVSCQTHVQGSIRIEVCDNGPGLLTLFS
jgi:two-component sensor histidine kinase